MISINEIVHPTRLRIMKILSQKPQTLTNISTLLEVSKPEISRHLAKLKELGVVHTTEKVHSVTNLGEFFLGALAPMEFILSNFEFFREHQIIDLPQSIVSQIDGLRGSELVYGTGYIMKKIGELNQIAAKELRAMVDQPFPRVRDSIVKNSYFILPQHAKDENIDFRAINDVSETFEIRSYPVINVSLGIIDQKFGFVFFPDLKGKIDYNAGFFISDPQGIEFLQSIWDYFWKRSKIRNISK